MRVGIIGGGFVGGALRFGFNGFCETKIYDINPRIATHSLRETVLESDFIFICVPTPMNQTNDGEADDRIILQVLKNIDEISVSPNSIVIVKSSVPPGYMEKFVDIYPRLRLVFNPEFLTEKNAKHDFINADRIVLGGNKK